jgi:excisionase family DNA binding protein
MLHGNRRGRRELSLGGGTNTQSAATVSLEPIGIPPKQAFELIGCGVTYGYQLLAAGELESYHLGRARRVTVASIHAFIQRRLAAAREGANGS